MRCWDRYTHILYMGTRGMDGSFIISEHGLFVQRRRGFTRRQGTVQISRFTINTTSISNRSTRISQCLTTMYMIGGTKRFTSLIHPRFGTPMKGKIYVDIFHDAANVYNSTMLKTPVRLTALQSFQCSSSPKHARAKKFYISTEVIPQSTISSPSDDSSR